MTIDPLVVVGFIAAMVSLVGAIIRMFMTGAIHPRSTVPREDFDALVAINASYAVGMAARTEAVKGMAEAMKGMATTIERIVPKNGVK